MSSLPSIVIVGRPNVGKSTLFNRLLGRRKALVHNLPGVTRDRNMSTMEHGGKKLQLVDTGGVLGESEDRLSDLVEEQVELAIRAGDLVLLLVDGKEGITPLDSELARRLITSGKRSAVVVNKVDAPGHEGRSAEFHAFGIEPVIAVSAEHGLGMDELWEFLEAELRAFDVPESDDAEASSIRIAIVGKPNVGKSSIVNRLVGENRSLVSAIPGTTRDPIDTPVSWRGKEMVLVDTAGIRRKCRTGRGAEVLSVILARRNLDDCEVALLVVDASQPLTHQDAHIAGLIEGARRAAVLVMNKWDLVDGAKVREIEAEAMERFRFMTWMPMIRVSAKSGRGFNRILAAAAAAHGSFSTAIATAVLNKAIADITFSTPPQSIGGKTLKIRYATQSGTSPPIITVFTNSKTPPPGSYSRFLKKQLRARFPLEGSPLIIKFRKE